MSKWPMIQLAQVSEFIGRGISPKYVEQAETVVLNQRCIRGGTVSLEPSRFHDETAKPIPSAKLLQNGDCLINSTGQGTLGRTAVFRHEGQAVQFTVDSHVTIVRPKPNLIDPNFLGHVLNSMESKFEELGTGSGGQIELSRQSVNDSVIPLPPLDGQKRIVAKLDEMSRMISTVTLAVEESRLAVGEIWRRMLEKVGSAKGDGAFSYTIAEVCTLRSGNTVAKDLESDSGELPYLKVADMNLAENSSRVVTSTRFLAAADVKRAQILPPGTTILPKRGGAIATNKKRLTAVPICADLNIMGVIPGPLVDPEFLYYYFQNLDLRSIGSGSSIPQINNYDIEPLKITLPTSLEVQREITLKLSRVREELDALMALNVRKEQLVRHLNMSLRESILGGVA